MINAWLYKLPCSGKKLILCPSAMFLAWLALYITGLAGCSQYEPPQRIVVLSFNSTNGNKVHANIMINRKFTTNVIFELRKFAEQNYGADTNNIVVLNVINLE